MDSELKELKEEFSKLSTLVSQMEMAKSQLSLTDKVQVIISLILSLINQFFVV